MASIFDNLVAAGIGSAGSLLGLPELGTSERYLNNRSGGGFVSPVASNQGSVLGASNTQQASNEFIGPTRPIGPLGPPSGYVAPSNNQQSSGGSGGSGNPESSNQEDIARDAESKLRKEADSIFGDAKRAADKSRGRAQGNYDSLLSDIGSIFGQQRESAATGAQQSARDLDAREQEAQRGKEDIIAQARQILQESGIGAGQRFGADSDIARALGEYANVGFQKAKTSAHNTFQQAKTQIMNQKMKIQEDYMNFIKNIDIQETTQKNDAYRSFQNVLNQIDSMVDQAGSERSNLRIQAI